MKFSSSATLDLKQIDAMMRRLQSLDSHHVEYGYFEGDIHQSSGLDIAELAATLNEDRPFMNLAYQMVDSHFETSKLWKKNIWNYLKGQGTVTQLYKEFGRIGEVYVQASIDTGDWIANEDWWTQAKIEKYGSTAPLIETGEMYNSVKSKVISDKADKSK